ncbi:TerD family protein [Streptomyces morookaense]|uniref:TerD family protein n=1 Tax=Streptomyces morookaense TaxID=1970 RepID=A0A7Y7E809_STRMO|nr:TerD family protein [Streptomyces morookaense]NVK79488.1 TerD family protein [Streptomyces morookaense]GHF04397.1 hypothetical protein GCM10010359_01560 [Streptomyces morookaense]
MGMLKGANAPISVRTVRVEVVRGSGPGASVTDACALLTAEGRVRSGADTVSRSLPVHPSGAVRHEGRRSAGGTVTDTFAVGLGVLDPAVERVLFTAAAEDGDFGRVPDVHIRVLDAADGGELARYDSRDATVETVLVLGELYRRHGGWRFRAVGQGWADGPAGLAAAYGAGAAEPAAPATRPAGPGRVTLTKQAPAVSLAKQGSTSGTLHVNLNWQMRQEPRGRRARLGRAPAAGVDLDLGALYELADGTKGVVQALGNSFGSLHRPPYIHLDGDDRTGAAADGENLSVDLDHAAAFRRILVFVTIYEGAASFAGLHATVTLRPQQGAPVDFALDECTVPSTVCALALLTHDGNGLVVRREARYLVPDRGVSPQRTLDRAYDWGLQWTPGRK